VSFRLFPDRLEFRHHGQLFDEKDVRGISDILKGTKRDEMDQIGKFGIGFKSVYAFTANPEIHSGDEHFRIERYIRPCAVQPKNIGHGETLIILPFDRSDVPPDTSRELIEKRLDQLGVRTLLFLRQVDEIKVGIGEAATRHYLREEEVKESARSVTVIGQAVSTEALEEERWLVFHRPVSKPNGEPAGVVETAFRLSVNEKSGQEQVAPISGSHLVVYFETAKETHLGFLIQGPYHTTPARDSILDDDWNQTLMREAASLVTDSLRRLKKMDLLTVSALETMPIRSDAFPESSAFRPIYDRIRTALEEEALLPTHDGGHVAGKDAKLARSEGLLDLLSSSQLSDLLGKGRSLEWLSGDITESRHDLYSYLVGRKLYERSETRADPIVDGLLVRHEQVVDRLDETFFSQQDDQWLARFYVFMGGQRSLWDELKKIPFIRLQNKTHVRPFAQNGTRQAYLVPQGVEADVPTVRSEATANPEARKFLEDIGLTEPDIVAEVIHTVLPRYRTVDHQISWEQHHKDMTIICHVVKQSEGEKKRQLLRELEDSPFLQARNAASEQAAFRRPGEVYLPSPELAEYFSGNDNAWMLDPEYDDATANCLAELGVSKLPRCSYRQANSDDEYVPIKSIVSQRGEHYIRGCRRFDPDCTIDGLESALNSPTVTKSRFIWNRLLVSNSHLVHGRVETCPRKTFVDSEFKEQCSEMGALVKEKAWLPNSVGQFHRPCDLSLDDLPEGFEHNEKLREQLGMKPTAISSLAKEAGVPMAWIKMFRSNPEEGQRIMALKQPGGRYDKPPFPVREPPDPGRRAAKVRERVGSAPQRTYEKRTRSVRTTAPDGDPRVVLRDLYTNDFEQLICQICRDEMPFKMRNGEYYFEAVQLSDDMDRELTEPYRALCPTCAAKYKEFVKSGPGKQDAQYALKAAIQAWDGSSLEIPVSLDTTSTIKFVEKHLLDLKTILNDLATEVPAGSYPRHDSADLSDHIPDPRHDTVTTDIPE